MYAPSIIVVFMTDDIEDSLLCDICGKACKSKKSLAAHKRFHNQDYVRKIVHPDPQSVCDICGREFARRCHLASHKRFHDKEYAEAFRQKIGEISRNSWSVNRERMLRILNSPEVSKKKGDSLRATYAKGIYDSESRSAAMKSMYANPDNADKIAIWHKHIKEATNSESERLRRSRLARRLSSDESYIRRLSESVTETWADESVATRRMTHSSKTLFSRKSIEHTRFGDILCESNIERRALSALCDDESIVSVTRGHRIPYMKFGRMHSYYPDFVVTNTAGHSFVIEVKSSNHIDDSDVKLKARYAEWFCFSHKMDYIMLTEKDIDSAIACGNPISSIIS